ncbi:hypothetical protein Golomagni_02168 [Golovinomyces magnicellulatus]|nr:hypothetical protein Golomagni_02168 [Golovinomyces magnicellulatus]
MIDAYTVPQDEYFEWEDVMDSFNTSNSRQVPFLSCYQAPSVYNSFFEQPNLDKQTAPPPPVYECHDFDWTFLQTDSNDSEQNIPLLNTPVEEMTMYSPRSICSTPEEEILSNDSPSTKAYDDLDIMPLPIQNVDYLTYAWHNCEADLWASRKYLKASRYENAELEKQTNERLRNASWRAVAAGRLNLKKVDPKSIQWNKEHDVTWLHGPFLKHHSFAESQNNGPQFNTATLDQSNKKPIKSILKHPSVSESLLRGSIAPVKTKKRQLDTTESETTRRKNLRFSSEILQLAAIPEKMTSTSIKAVSPNNYNTVYSDKYRDLNSSQFICQDTNFDFASLNTPTLELKHKAESTWVQPRDARNSDDMSIRNIYSSFSGNSPVDIVADDVAALSRALKEVIDAHQRGFKPQQYQIDMPLWPTITA